MLEERLRFMTGNVTDSLKKQQDRATKQDIEYNSLTTELTNLKNVF